ncbi:hypothetical protein BC831DRAFT_239071 [Entophlyctis helioformis]|nr:hypothetical protein BC831DRAFT_239071 [Entophlyctis helioformis]
MDLFPNGIYSEPTPAQVINPYGNGYFPAEIDMHEILSIGLARPKLPYAGADLHEPSFASPQALPSAMAHAHANNANVASVPAAIASPAVHAHASCSSAQPILHSQSAQHPSTPLWSPESFKPASSLAQPDQSQLLALGNLATPPHQMPLAMDDTPSLMITSPATSFSVSNYPQGQMGANAATKHTTSGLLDGAFQTLQSAYQLFQHHEQLYAQQQQQQQQQQTAGMIPHASPFPIHQTASAIPDHQLTVPTTQYNATSFSANAPCSMTGSIGTGSTVRSTTIPGGQPSSLLNMASAAAVLPPPAPVKVRKPRAPRNPAKPPRSRSKAGAAQMTAMLPSDAIAQSFAGTALAKFESGAAALSAAAPSGIPPAADPSTQAVAADLFGTAAPSASSAADADTALSVSIASLYAPAPEPVSAPVVQAKRPGRPPSKTPGRKKAQQVAGAGGPTTPAKRGPRPKATNPDGTPVARKPRAEPYARATGKAAAARAAKKAAAIHASSAKLSGGDFFLDSVLSAPFVADSDLVVQPGAPSDLLLPDASVQGDCQAFAVQELVGSTQPAKDMLAALESLASVDAAGMLGLGGSGSKSVAASEAQAVNTVDADAGVAPMSS